MSSAVHNVITRRRFDFSNVAGGSALDVPLVRALDMSDAKSIDVVVRIHALTVTSTASIAIHCRAISLTSEEPDVDFSNITELGTTTLNTTFTGLNTIPALALTELTPPWGNMIRIFVRGTQPASPVTLSATLSIDLVVRDN